MFDVAVHNDNDDRASNTTLWPNKQRHDSSAFPHIAFYIRTQMNKAVSDTSYKLMTRGELSGLVITSLNKVTILSLILWLSLFLCDEGTNDDAKNAVTKKTFTIYIDSHLILHAFQSVNCRFSAFCHINCVCACECTFRVHSLMD